MPNFEMFQRLGDWFEQRAEFRKQALASLRRREGLPTPELVDGKMQYRQADGTYSTMAVGTRKQASETVIDEKGIPRTVPTIAVDTAWNRGGGFEILDVAEDGTQLTSELADLQRDAAAYERGAQVSHGEVGEMAPGLVLDGTEDEEIDRKLQEFLKRGQR
jgi:hypothetical protein